MVISAFVTKKKFNLVQVHHFECTGAELYASLYLKTAKAIFLYDHWCPIFAIYLLKTGLGILDFYHSDWLNGARLSAHIPAVTNMDNEHSTTK